MVERRTGQRDLVKAGVGSTGENQSLTGLDRLLSMIRHDE